MQRFNQKFLPESFNLTWKKNSIRNIGENEIVLRNAEQLQPIHSSLFSLEKFPLYDFPKIWQKFPEEQIKIVRNKLEFDTKLKKFFLDDLSNIVVCERLLCPACLTSRLA